MSVITAAAQHADILAANAVTGLIALVIDIVIAFVCANIAGGKGYSRILFGILGFFFNIITLIVVLVLPRKR